MGYFLGFRSYSSSFDRLGNGLKIRISTAFLDRLCLFYGLCLNITMIKARKSGFTIVELLIVIVVIAILAAISIVAYGGVQERAYGAAIQSELVNNAKKVQLVLAETGSYPTGGYQVVSDGGSTTGHVSYAPQPSVGFTINKASYWEPTASGSANLTYCTGTGLVSGMPEYVLTAQSKAGKIYQQSSIRGSESLSSASFGGSVICSGIGYPRSISYGFFTNSGGWQSWVNG